MYLRSIPMGEQILLVDDDKDVLETFLEFLEICGYHIITATNGKEAVELYKQKDPCIVFMDIKMPEMDGYEAFSEIRKQDDKAKVVLITGHNDERKSQEALKKGLKDVLLKPINSQQIVDLIKENNC